MSELVFLKGQAGHIYPQEPLTSSPVYKQQAVLTDHISSHLTALHTTHYLLLYCSSFHHANISITFQPLRVLKRPGCWPWSLLAPTYLPSKISWTFQVGEGCLKLPLSVSLFLLMLPYNELLLITLYHN